MKPRGDLITRYTVLLFQYYQYRGNKYFWCTIIIPHGMKYNYTVMTIYQYTAQPYCTIIVCNSYVCRDSYEIFCRGGGSSSIGQ